MCKCSDDESADTGDTISVTSTVPTVKPLVPLSRQVRLNDQSLDVDVPASAAHLMASEPTSLFKPCKLAFQEGCYQLAFIPTGSVVTYEGTLRVDLSAPDAGADNLIVSGDLYSKLPVHGRTDRSAIVTNGNGNGEQVDDDVTRPTSLPTTLAGALSAVDQPIVPELVQRPKIPVFPRDRYHSYLKVTKVSAPTQIPIGAKCEVTIVAEQFNYTQPPTGTFKGTFSSTPSRTVTLKLSKVSAPFPFSLTGGSYYEGRLFEGTVDQGRVTLAWVSKFFRRATLEIDTLLGAVRPAPVPDGSGGTEFFDTIFAKTGWNLKVVQDQLNIPVPSGVTPTNCWSAPDLHALMTNVRNPATNLDAEWHVHLIIVPAKLGCSRGVMYDQIGVPREGCASFSDDGYPVSDSSNFGSAANMKQRDVPRAFLRSATHEVTHTLNQIHQEQETSADNSIMTTTPSVADVLGGPATGEPGVFPDQIKLVHNSTVRNHLNHMPDPVIRPGGWPFASWFPTGAPQASDRYDFALSELDLTIKTDSQRIALGQPLRIEWMLTNASGVPLRVPNDISIEALFATITVIDGEGRERPFRPFAIVCEHSKLRTLEAGESVSASSRLFWSTEGFAFQRPGRYYVNVAVSWSAQGVLVGVQNQIEVFVDYPITPADNQAADLVLHPEVGKWVALGGNAYHLPEACRRLVALSDTMEAAGTNKARAMSIGAGDGIARPSVFDGFAGLLPDRRKVAKLVPEQAHSDRVDQAVSTRKSARRPVPKRAPKKRRRGR
jgi:hypothetical protein